MEFIPESESGFLADVKASYMDLVKPYVVPIYDSTCGFKRLFMLKYNECTPIRRVEIERMNTFVRNTLLRVVWKVPVLRPTIKCHKTPLKIRPVISKRGTAIVCRSGE